MSNSDSRPQFYEDNYPASKIQESTFKADFMKPVYNYISYLQARKAKAILLKKDDFKDYAIDRIMKVWLKQEFNIQDDKSKTLEEFEKDYQEKHKLTSLEYWIPTNVLKSHISHKKGEPKEDPIKAINEYIAMNLVKRFCLQYENEFINNESHKIPCETIEKGMGSQTKRSFDTMISYDFENEMKVEYNQLVIKYVNTVNVLIKKIQAIVKEKIIKGELKQVIRAKEIKEKNKKGVEVSKGYKADIINANTYKKVLKELIENIITSQMNRNIDTEIDEAIEEMKFENDEDKEKKIKDLKKKKQFELQPKSFDKIDEYYEQIKNYEEGERKEYPLKSVGNHVQKIMSDKKDNFKASQQMTAYYLRKYIPEIIAVIVRKIDYYNTPKQQYISNLFYTETRTNEFQEKLKDQIHVNIIEKIEHFEKKTKDKNESEPAEDAEPIEGEIKEEKPKKRTRKAKKEEITDDEDMPPM